MTPNGENGNTERSLTRLEEQSHTDERMSVLIQMMDDWIKRQG